MSRRSPVAARLFGGGALALVLALATAGCARDDLCADSAGITCLTVKLVGDVDVGKALARVQVDTYYTNNTHMTSHREVIGPKDAVDGGLSLPVEFPVVFSSRLDKLPDCESSIVITALDDSGAPIGIVSSLFGCYSAAPSLKLGDHGYTQLKLTPAMKDSQCFAQSPPKCGSSDCPLCPAGAGCEPNTTSSGYTCASGFCQADPPPSYKGTCL